RYYPAAVFVYAFPPLQPLPLPAGRFQLSPLLLPPETFYHYVDILFYKRKHRLYGIEPGLCVKIKRAANIVARTVRKIKLHRRSGIAINGIIYPVYLSVRVTDHAFIDRGCLYRMFKAQLMRILDQLVKFLFRLDMFIA